MSASARTGYDQLPPDQAERVDLACDRFEQAWKQKGRPPLETFMGETAGAERLALLQELVLIDADYRRRAGEIPTPSDYDQRFTELPGDWLEQHLDTFKSLPRSSAVSALPVVPGYEIISEVGRGGMGVVYKARDTRLDRFVALKVLRLEAAANPQHLERFRREARAASSLNHPTVCTLHDFGEHQGQSYLVLEWIEGRTLRSLIGTQPDLARVLPLLQQAAAALRVAHAAGIVHRDIKPENLMVRPDGYVKVLDFGLARLLTPSTFGNTGSRTDTDPGMLLGTPWYMSPEQSRGEPVGSASDIFSLGIVLYEFVTGLRPFATLDAITTQPVYPPSRLNRALPAPLEALILQMLEKDPRRRPTAAAVEAGLAQAAGSGGARAGSVYLRRRATVGQTAERAALRAGFTAAAAGHGSVLCVTGEPGLGKTTLVEEFLAELAGSGRDCCIAQGRCSERLVGAEAYLPVLEALESLTRSAAAELASRALQKLAPSWHAQLAPVSGAPVQPQAASTERLKRELLAFFEEMCRLRPLVWFIDDVHWADLSTVDLLAYLGTRCQRMRLLVLVTYRPTEILLGQHPFVSVQLELKRHGVCREIPLSFLGSAEVASYLATTFPGHRFPPDFTALIHSRTEGNPLFLVELLRYLRDRGVIAEGPKGWELAQPLPDFQSELPESVRSMIRKKLDQLDEADRRLLSAASVQGNEFSSTVVARALKLDSAEVEERLAALDSVHGLVWLMREQEYPDGTPTARYCFVHVLYQNSLYAGLQPARRRGWSAAVAQALLDLNGVQSAAVAGELALLFEAAHDWTRASGFFGLAAENAARVYANREAVGLARRGLSLVAKISDSAERARQELRLQMALTVPLQTTLGYSSPEAGAACRRAHALCEQLGESVDRYPVLWRLSLFSMIRGELQTARSLAEQCLHLAEARADPGLELEAHLLIGTPLVYLVELPLALKHLEQCIALHDPVRDAALTVQYGDHPVVIAQCFLAWVRWLLGHTDQALATLGQALALAEATGHPPTLVNALFFAAKLHGYRRDIRRTVKASLETIRLAREQDIALYQASGSFWHGWALAQQGQASDGIAQMRQALADFRLAGAGVQVPQMLGMLAEALVGQNHLAEGQASLAEALAHCQTGNDRSYEAELYRLQGELLLRSPEQPGQAEAWFRRSLEVARRQGVQAFELRTATGLARLLGRQDRAGEGRQLLAECCSGFTEGWNSPDLREAMDLLAALG